MRLLLDSHIAIWSATSESKLTAGEREALAIASPVVSVVTTWEAGFKWNSLYAPGERKGAIDPVSLLAFVQAFRS